MDLSRFITAQEAHYETALAEITAGQKTSHWMWFIFPQLRSLGRSPRAEFYGISGIEEARAYLKHPVLGVRLEEISRALLAHSNESAEDILGPVDALKLRSCATLFSEAGSQPVFREILDKFYEGSACKLTLEALG